MPTLLLKVAPLQNPPRYQQLTQALTRLRTLHLHKRAEVTAVVIEDLPAARWFVDSQPLQRPTALLEISITAGTNSAAEKKAFIAAAYTELAAGDWGYAGVTQATRRSATFAIAAEVSHRPAA